MNKVLLRLNSRGATLTLYSYGTKTVERANDHKNQQITDHFLAVQYSTGSGKLLKPLIQLQLTQGRAGRI